MGASARHITIPSQRVAAAAVPSIRVYVSSTYRDLVDCRAKIRLALQRIGLDDAAMETYTAGEDRPLDTCLADVRSADLYVGVLAWRYGFIPPGHDTSITELEYREAGKAGIPRLMFVLDPSAPWSPLLMDRPLDRIESFREHVMTAHICDTFRSVDELRAMVAEVVGKTLRNAPGSTDTEAAWDDYCARLVQEYQRLDLDALTPPERDEHLQIALRDVFIEPDVREDMPEAELPKELRRKLEEASERGGDLPPGLDRLLLEQSRETYQRKPAQAALATLAEPLGRNCVLLGDPGAGKSTLVKYLALALAEGRTDGSLAPLAGWRPILIELRDYALNCGAYETFASYLDYRRRTDGLGLDQETFERHLADDGRVLVIFDGLDEVFEPRLRETVARRIAGFASQHPTARVVVTSRVIGYRARILRDAGFAHHTVQDLDTIKIDEFLRSWYAIALHDRPRAAELRRERLGQAIKESPPIRELAGNPLLLTILAIIGKHQELPRERWKVYDHAASVLVQHWDVNKHLVDAHLDADVIREDDKKDLLCRIAIRMQEGSHGVAGNSLVEEDLLADVEAYLVERFQYDRVKARAITSAMVKQLRERNFILARYGSRVYGFVHRALLEFFAAKEIVHRFEKSRRLSEDELVADVFVKRSEEATWAEVLRLIAGMVDAGVASRLIDGLLASRGTYRSSALDPRPLPVVALAAQCVAEIRNINAAAGAAEQTVRAVIELLRLPTRSFGGDSRTTSLEKRVLPAFAAVAAWPGREVFREWFESTGRFSCVAPTSELSAQLLAALFPADESVHALLLELTRGVIPEQRAAALTGLANQRKDAPEVLDAIVGAALGDPEAFVRRAALDLLITKWPTEIRTHDAIRRCTGDIDADLRKRAVEALARHAANAPGARPTVTNALLTDGSHPVRNAAADALAATWPAHDETRGLLLRACEDPAWEVRQAVLRLVVARFAGDQQVRSTVHAAVQDPDEDVRATAVELLASRWTEAAESFEAVFRATRDADHKVRRAAIKSMAQRWPEAPETGVAIDRALSDPNAEVRLLALTAGTAADGAQLTARLRAVVTGRDNADVRRAALRLLVAEAPEECGDLIKLGLTDLNAQVRVAALSSLADGVPAEGALLPLVLRLCEDVNHSVRLEAVQAAARFWGQSDEVTAMLARVARADPLQLRRTALEALASLRPGDSATRTALVCGRRDPIDVVRYAAYKLDAALFGARPDVLDPALLDPYLRIRQIAADLVVALGRVGDEPGRPAAIRNTLLRTSGEGLREAVSDPEASVRLTAHEGVVLHRRDHADALELTVQASRDLDDQVRLFGLSALLVAWPHHPETEGARRRGLADTSAEIRRLALESSILNARDDQATRRAVEHGVRDPDWTVRRMAMFMLCRSEMADGTALDRMHAALRHPDFGVRSSVRSVLWVCRPDDPRVVDAWIEGVGDPASYLRVAALHGLALSRLGDPRVAELVDEARASVDADLAIAAWELTGQRTIAAGLSVRHPVTAIRRAAFEQALRSAADPAELVSLLRLGVRDRDEEIRDLVSFALMICTDDHVVREVLRDTAGHWSHRVRRVGLEARVARRPQKAGAWDHLLRALNDSGDAARCDALAGLVELDAEAPEVFDAAVTGLSDSDGEMRAIAIRVLATRWADDPRTPEWLVRASRDVASSTRQAALEALLVVWPRSDVTRWAVENALYDVDETVRAVARRARDRGVASPPVEDDARTAGLLRLRRAADQVPDARNSRRVALDLAEDGDPQVREAALQVLVRRWPDGPETIMALEKARGDGDRRVRVAALRAQAETFPGTPVTWSMLKESLADPIWWNRHAAADMLQAWSDEPTRSILARAAMDPVPVVKDMVATNLAVRWPASPETRRVMMSMGRASDYSRGLAHGYLTRRYALTSPTRDSLIASGDLEALLVLGTHWPDDARVAGVLLDSAAAGEDLVRAAALDGLMSWNPAGEELLPLLDTASRDSCPVVQELAMVGLARLRGTLPDAAVGPRTDPLVVCQMLVARAIVDKSADCAEAMLATLRRDTDQSLSVWLFDTAARWASAGLLDPARLTAAVGARPFVIEEYREWLRWLALLSGPGR
jgi:hypothetical protein